MKVSCQKIKELYDAYTKSFEHIQSELFEILDLNDYTKSLNVLESQNYSDMSDAYNELYEYFRHYKWQGLNPKSSEHVECERLTGFGNIETFIDGDDFTVRDLLNEQFHLHFNENLALIASEYMFNIISGNQEIIVDNLEYRIQHLRFISENTCLVSGHDDVNNIYLDLYTFDTENKNITRVFREVHRDASGSQEVLLLEDGISDSTLLANNNIIIGNNEGALGRLYQENNEWKLEQHPNFSHLAVGIKSIDSTFDSLFFVGSAFNNDGLLTHNDISSFQKVGDSPIFSIECHGDSVVLGKKRATIQIKSKTELSREGITFRDENINTRVRKTYLLPHNQLIVLYQDCIVLYEKKDGSHSYSQLDKISLIDKLKYNQRLLLKDLSPDMQIDKDGNLYIKSGFQDKIMKINMVKSR